MGGQGSRAMRAKELMHRDVFTIRDNESVESLLEVLVGEHLHGAPVIDEEGRLVGVVSQQDIFFSAATRRPDPDAKESEQDRTQPFDPKLRVRDIMTSPAVSADEETDVRRLCRLMQRLRIHRIPIVRDGRLTGIVSSLDVCGAIARRQSFD